MSSYSVKLISYLKYKLFHNLTIILFLTLSLSMSSSSLFSPLSSFSSVFSSSSSLSSSSLSFSSVDALTTTSSISDSINEIEDKVELVVKHANEVYNFGACREPKPRIVYPGKSSMNKIYFPRGTILHRCNDEIGCCHHSTYTCQAVETDIVHRYFFIFNPSLTKSRHHRRQRRLPQLLSFVNHTKCACVSGYKSSSNNDDDEISNE